MLKEIQTIDPKGINFVKLTAYYDTVVFDELQAEWNTLLHKSAMDCIFSTWEWAQTWWGAYHPGKLWVITCRDANDTLMGIAPWFIKEGDAGREVHTIGCIDVTDYLDVIADATCTDAVLDCFAGYLADHVDEFNRIALCNVPQTSPTYENFPQLLANHGFDVDVTPDEVCPIIMLPDSWDAYLESLDKKQRHELRRKLRRAEGVNDAVDWYQVDQTHNFSEQLDLFLDLMGKSTPEKAKFLEDAQNQAFFKAMMPLAMERGWLQLNFLTVDGQPVASYLNFDYQGRILVYNSGLDHHQHGQLSPGIVLLCYNVRHAIENRRKVFDFLRGNEEYKYRMGAEDTIIYRISAQPTPQEQTL